MTQLMVSAKLRTSATSENVLKDGLVQRLPNVSVHFAAVYSTKFIL